METISFNIIKKNRKYFAATKAGYKCKILIDENSQDLELGSQTVVVEDISIHSKYGTDLIFKLSVDATEQKSSGICTLKTPKFNTDMVNACRNLGGRWDKECDSWIFPEFAADQVDILDEKYNSDLMTIELTFKNAEYGDCGPISVAGFMLVNASGRDSGAWLAKDVLLIKGDINSGGSRKNWRPEISEGAVLRMQIPVNCLPDIDTENVSIDIV